MKLWCVTHSMPRPHGYMQNSFFHRWFFIHYWWYLRVLLRISMYVWFLSTIQCLTKNLKYLNLVHHIVGLAFAGMLAYAAYFTAEEAWFAPWGEFRLETSGSVLNALSCVVERPWSLSFVCSCCPVCVHPNQELMGLRKNDDVWFIFYWYHAWGSLLMLDLWSRLATDRYAASVRNRLLSRFSSLYVGLALMPYLWLLAELTALLLVMFSLLAVQVFVLMAAFIRPFRVSRVICLMQWNLSAVRFVVVLQFKKRY